MSEENLNYYLFDEVWNGKLNECNLSQGEIEDFLSPVTDQWMNVSPIDFETNFNLDEAKISQ